MNKGDIIQLLKSNHAAFIATINQLSKEEFEKKVDDKWSPGQQAYHLLKSISPVITACKMPGFLLKLFFGKANRPSKTYEALVAKYQLKLQAGGKAPARFAVQEIYPYYRKEQVIHAINKQLNALTKLINSMSEDALDTYILPHPLLGKLTLREMFYFTAYHVTHHHRSINEIVQAK